MFTRSSSNNVASNTRSRGAFRDLTNANQVGVQGGKPGQNVLPEKRAARTEAYVPTRQHIYQQQQPFVLEQRNPTNSTNVPNRMSRTVTNDPANLSSYQYGPPDNIDERDSDDPLCATDYVQDMYEHFRGKETLTSVRPLYMESQSHINERMRSILVDWLVEVHLKYLERQEVSRPKLQLVGVTSLLIASKYEEIYPPELRDLVYICDRAYTRSEIIEMEEKILKTLNYNITIPSAHAFLVRFLKAAHADKRIVQLSCYILDGTLQSYNLLHYLPSQLAAAAVYIARRTVGRNSWSPTLLKYANYREEEITPIARAVIAEKSSSSPELRAVNKKYTSSRYGGVANMALSCDF
eukprot:scaffold1525_cov142-Cylindrotheca_fusiformis.AAC.76